MRAHAGCCHHPLLNSATAGTSSIARAAPVQLNAFTQHILTCMAACEGHGALEERMADFAGQRAVYAENRLELWSIVCIIHVVCMRP